MPTVTERDIQYADAAAALHRRAGALIPGYDPLLQTADKFRDSYSTTLMQNDLLWGAFEDRALLSWLPSFPTTCTERFWWRFGFAALPEGFCRDGFFRVAYDWKY